MEITSTPRDGQEAFQTDGIHNAPVIKCTRIDDNTIGINDWDNSVTAPYSFMSHSTKDRHIFHDKALLPPSYSWATVHAEAKISWAQPSGAQQQDTTGGSPSISSNYNWIQSLVAIFQAGSAAVTLYKSHGDQIQRYGYAAFGLTVVPYLIMSIVNLVAQIAAADYPTVYMVGSPEMDEARGRGGVFDGVVGMLEPGAQEPETELQAEAEKPVYEVKLVDGGEAKRIVAMERARGSDEYPPLIRFGPGGEGYIHVMAYTPFTLYTRPSGSLRTWHFQSLVLPIISECLSLVVVGAWTRFEKGESTTAQRGWIMSWLVVGIACGFWADTMSVIFIPK
jgi:hypothetical protein